MTLGASCLAVSLLFAQGLSTAPKASTQSRRAGQEISTARIEKMVDVGGRKLHGRLYGQGAPAVVLVSGFGAPQDYWNPIVPSIAEDTLVVTYDRAGYGRSEAGSLSCDGRRAMRELKTFLEASGIEGPWVIVGHSLGGRMAQIFASLFPDLTAGLVLLDTGYRDPRLPWRQDGGRAARDSGGESLEAPPGMRTETECNDLTWRQVEAISSLPHVPLTVVTAGRLQSPPWLTAEEKRKAAELRRLDQEALVRMIPGGKHIVLPDSGHNVIKDAPEAVAQAIRNVIRLVRR